MKRKILEMSAIFLILCGLALIILPQLVLAYNDAHNDSMIEVYEKHTLEQVSDVVTDKMLLKAQDYNNRLYLGLPTAQSEYDALLQEDQNGMMGYVSIPSLDLRVPLFHDTKQALEQGAVHVLGTSLPVGGESTHCVIAAHTGNQNGRFFTDLTDMKEGDEFTVNVLGESLLYKVFRIKTVLPDNLKYLQIKEGCDYCTLLTCTPYGVNSHRLLVTGKRVESKEQCADSADSQASVSAAAQASGSASVSSKSDLPADASHESSTSSASYGEVDPKAWVFDRHISWEAAGTILLVIMVFLQVSRNRKRGSAPADISNNRGEVNE